MADPSGHTSMRWELSLYEQSRLPQDPIEDNTEVAVTARSLHNELMCPICLDMLKTTMTTKECLHRFCNDCIITALRSGNKECPTCRKKLVSKRSLRPDPNFDSLIKKIYPSRDDYEAHQERMLAKLKTHNDASSLAQSINEGMNLQAQHRAQRVNKKAVEVESGASANPPINDIPSTPTHTSDTESIGTASLSKRGTGGEEWSDTPSEAGSTSDISNACNVREIDFVIIPHPEEIQSRDCMDCESTRKQLKTTANASMLHLSKYIGVRINIEGKHGNAGHQRGVSEGVPLYKLFVRTSGGQFVQLQDRMTLEQVNDHYWKVNRPVELYYLAQK